MQPGNLSHPMGCGRYEEGSEADICIRLEVFPRSRRLPRGGDFAAAPGYASKCRSLRQTMTICQPDRDLAPVAARAPIREPGQGAGIIQFHGLQGDGDKYSTKRIFAVEGLCHRSDNCHPEALANNRTLPAQKERAASSAPPFPRGSATSPPRSAR